MNLLDSLLDAIVRLDGDALVMHVGEKPYLVTTTSAMSEFRGPLLWGQVDLASRVLTSEALLGLLGQLLPDDQRHALQELGAIEHVIDAPERNARFSVIAARAGDDVWVEVRRRPRPVPAAVEEPVLDDQLIAPEPALESPVEPRVAPVATPIESPVVTHVEVPVEQEPVYVADSIEAVEQFAATAAVAVNGHAIDRPTGVDEPVAAIGVEEDEAPAPFEIVHEVNQDAPTDAEVDALLAESAAALLRSAAPAIDRDPLDLDHGAWQELEGDSRPLAFEPEPESIPVIASEPAVIAEQTPPVMPGPMRLASEIESIAIASELVPAASIAPALEYVPLIAQVDALAPLVSAALPMLEPRPEEAAEALVPEPVSLMPDAESVAIVQDAVVEDEEYDPVAFDEELEREEDFRFDDAAEFVAESVAMVPELELVLAGAASEHEAVGFAEDFRLVAPTAETFAPLPVAMESQPEILPLAVGAQAELFAFVQEIEPENFLKTEATEVTSGAVATAADSEPVLVNVAPEIERIRIEAASQAAPLESNHIQARQPVATVDASDPPAVRPEREQPVMASVPKPDSPVQPERPVIVPVAPRLPAVESRAAGGSTKTESRRDSLTNTTSPDPTAPEFSLDELLRVAAARGASTVYLVAQSRPMVRAEGDISVLDIGAGTALDEADITRLMDVAPEPARDAWQRGTSAEWVSDVAGVGRVRCMTFRDHRGPGMIFRMIPPQAISADHLGTHEVQALSTQSDGLVLVAGPRGSGKSTLMSAFVDLMNQTRSDHVITIEPEIEFVHQSRRSFVSQREVGASEEAIVSAVRSALREDPDVLFIGELSSPGVAAAALDAAESGRLVVASVPSPSTAAAIDRLVELLPADRPHGRASIASSLRAVVAEVLVGRSRGGRVAAREVLLNTAAVAALIEEGKTDQLPLAIENGRRHGMMPLNDALTVLVREGTVHVAEAYRKAVDKESLLAALRQEGVDTSFAEKIA